MAAGKNHWIVCAEHAAGPFAEAEATRRLCLMKDLRDRGDRFACLLPHVIAVSARKPETAADRDRILRESQEDNS